MTPQFKLDRRLRQAILSDARVVCALAYGSLTQGTGDHYSGLECHLFVPNALTPRFDPQAFLAGFTPVRHFVINEFGTPNVVTDDLLRIELHVEPVERLNDIFSWPGYSIDAIPSTQGACWSRTAVDSWLRCWTNSRGEAHTIQRRTLPWCSADC